VPPVTRDALRLSTLTDEQRQDSYQRPCSPTLHLESWTVTSCTLQWHYTRKLKTITKSHAPQSITVRRFPQPLGTSMAKAGDGLVPLWNQSLFYFCHRNLTSLERAHKCESICFSFVDKNTWILMH